MTILFAVQTESEQRDRLLNVIRVIWIYRNVVLTERIISRIPLIPSHRTIDSFSDVDLGQRFSSIVYYNVLKYLRKSSYHRATRVLERSCFWLA